MKLYDLTAPQMSIYHMAEFVGGAIDTVSGSMLFNHNYSDEAIISAINKMMKLHDALRIRLVHGEVPKQYFKDYCPIEVPVLEFDTEDQFNIWAEERARLPMKTDGDLYEFFIIKTKERKGLFNKIHHIASDAWSVVHLYFRIMDYCNDENLMKDTTEESRSYTAFIDKNIKYYQSQRYQKDYNFWQEKLNQCLECVTLSMKNGQGFQSQRLTKILNHDLVVKVKGFCKEYQVSEYNLFMTVLGIYLSKVAQKEQFYIGTTLLNREGTMEKNTLGMYVSSQAFPVNIRPTTFLDNLLQCKIDIFESLRHQRYSFTDVLEQMYERNQDKLFDVTLNYQNAIGKLSNYGDIFLHHSKLIIESLDIHIYDMFENGQDEIQLNYDYQICKYDEWEVEFHHRHMMEILNNVLANPEIKISDIDYLDHGEKDLLRQFNKTAVPYNLEESIVELFERQVEKFPDRIAVKYEEEKITYQELNERANQIGKILRDYGVVKDDFVAIIAERSIEMVIAVYGVLKSGGAYVPIDPNYPEDRIEYILDDCKARVILSYGVTVKTSAKVIDLEKPVEEATKNLPLVNKPSDLAYCIYTSGTTGRPKGVMVEHRSLLNLIYSYEEIYGLTKDDTVLQFASFSFDQSVWDIFNITLIGGTLCMIRSGMYSDIKTFTEYVNRQGVTVAALTPAYISECDPKEFKTLRLLDSGGEKAREDSLKEWSQYVRMFNTYGPTEATVNAITFEYPAGFEGRMVPIGKPAHNYQVFVIKEDRLCAIGEAGELCISGIGLARGYLNKPDLTAEKFSNNNSFSEGRIYHTGDMARWLPDGNIEYLGRIDKQVKIRGFRIELGEIENVIRSQENINDAVVICKNNHADEPELHGYLVSASEIDLNSLKTKLAQTLPIYMIPSFLMQIREIPLNNSGKVNERALPNIETQCGDNYVEPENEMEQELCMLFEKVLAVDKAGTADDFFDLGGHSLKATRLINKIESEFGIRLQISELFKFPTVKQLAGLIVGKEQKVQRMPKAENKKFYPVSSAQKGIYTIHSLDQNTISYNMPVILEFAQKVDLDRLDLAFNKLIERYETLRTSFHLIDGEIMQQIAADFHAKIDVVSIEETDKEQEFRKFVRAFELDKIPLMRIKCYRAGEKEYVLIDIHHLISDGISTEIYIRDLLQLYDGISLEPVKYQYKDYSEWVQNRDYGKAKAYWGNLFKQGVKVLNLPLDFTRSAQPSFAGGRVIDIIDGDLMEQMEAKIKKAGLTDYMFLLSAFFILLSKYSRQEEIVIGTPVFGRSNSDMEQMAGMFVNTIILNGRAEKTKSIGDFFEEVKETCLNSFEHQDYPFDELVNQLNPHRHSSRNPLFDVMFALEEDYDEFDNITMTDLDCEDNISKFDLTLTVIKGKSGYRLDFEYRTDLLKKETIINMVSHFKTLIADIPENFESLIGDLSMVSEQEKIKLLETFNDTEKTYSFNKSAIEMFEKQVNKTPDQIALIFKDQKMTYQELNQAANYIGYQLMQKGIGTEDFVALLTEKSFEMVIGMLGILKAGAAYVPVSLTYPSERISYIIKDSGAKAVITYQIDHMLLEGVPDVPELKLENLRGFHGLNPAVVADPGHAAYAIYTSGTTGKPKGVVIEHYSLLNLVNAYKDIYQISPADVVLQFANISFDQSVFDIFSPLLTGASLCIVPQEYIGDLLEMERYLNINKVSVMGLTPSYLRELNPEKFKYLRLVESGGAEAEIDVLNRWKEKVTVFNTYGPTETTVNASSYNYNHYHGKMKSIPIGKPTYNTQIYILDGYSLCGIGVPGELCIAGHGVARGYLNQTELTAQKFIDHPFGPGKLYRTGDLARWLSDGNIEYMGRIDQQIKIRGYRIELEEIKNVISALDFIEDVAVTVITEQDQDPYICAYLIAKQVIDIKSLREQLLDQLPDYMVPARFMQIERIPTNSSGKVDIKALPFIQVTEQSGVKLPGNDVEQNLLNVFKEVLGIESLSITDNFFEVGGDSIKAIRVVSKLRDIGYQTSTRNILNYKTIEMIALHISKDSGFVDQGAVSGEVLLTPIQLDFAANDFVVMNHYNQALLLKSKSKMDLQFIDLAMKEIVCIHDMLRAVYGNGKLQILQNEECLYHTMYCDLTQEHDYWNRMKERNKKIQQEMDLYNGCLIKACLYDTTVGSYLFLCAHHLVIDGVSWRIILGDLELAYRQCINEQPLKLPAKTSSYPAWSKALRQYAAKGMIKNQFSYWNQVCQEIAKNSSRVSGFDLKSQKKSFRLSLSAELSDQFITEAPKSYHTNIEDLLLTSLAITMRNWQGKKKLSVELESYGREDVDKKIIVDRTVGWFTNVYPVLFDCEGTIEKLIINTKETLRKIPQNGIGYGLLRHFGEEQLPVIKPQICFNYLGSSDFGQTELFELIEYSSTDDISEKNHLEHEISVDVLERQKQLYLEITYDGSQYTDHDIEQMGRCFEQAVYSVVEHCLHLEEAASTLSDFGNVEVEDSEMELFLDFIDKL